MRGKSASPLRAARKSRGMTIDQLRQLTNISAGRLSMIERGMGRPHPDERRRLAEALGAPEAELFPD